MKKIISITTLLLLLLVQDGNSQEKGGRIYSSSIKEINFYKYDAFFKIKAIKNFKAIKNKFPEELMQSILSCSSPEWEIFNTLGGKENADINDATYYNNIKLMNVENNYFELKHKFEFEIDGIPTAIIKFHFISQDNPTPQAGLIVMQNYNNQWYKTSMKMVSNLAMVTLRLKTEELEKIVLGITNTPQLKEINKNVFIKGILDFNKLNSEIDSWYIEETKENEAKKEYFKDPYSIL